MNMSPSYRVQQSLIISLIFYEVSTLLILSTCGQISKIAKYQYNKSYFISYIYKFKLFLLL